MLFLKECKKIVRSLTFWIYCIFVVLMFATQYYADCMIKPYEPHLEQESYGYKVVEDHDLIMSEALNTLLSEYSSNRYTCYPFGFYKAVHLKENKRKKVEEYLMELTDTDNEGLEAIIEQGESAYIAEGVSEYEMKFFDNIKLKSAVSYERFTEIMGDIDDILGGGSEYAVDSLVYKYSQVPMTYEDAVEEYETFVNDEKITGALSRLFSDYMGIILAVLPIFVTVAFINSDRRHGVNNILYSKQISSAKLLFTRYVALVVMLFIPVLVTMLSALIQALIVYKGYTLDIPVMFTLPTFWLLPEIMIVTALGMLITETFSSGTAILVQVIWAFLSLMSGGAELSGDIGKFDLICRHNTLGERDVFLLEQNNFVFNRVFYMILSLIIILLTVWVYNLKRGGKFNGFRLFGEGGILRHKA